MWREYANINELKGEGIREKVCGFTKNILIFVESVLSKTFYLTRLSQNEKKYFYISKMFRPEESFRRRLLEIKLLAVFVEYHCLIPLLTKRPNFSLYGFQWQSPRLCSRPCWYFVDFVFFCFSFLRCHFSCFLIVRFSICWYFFLWWRLPWFVLGRVGFFWTLRSFPDFIFKGLCLFRFLYFISNYLGGL